MALTGLMLLCTIGQVVSAVNINNIEREKAWNLFEAQELYRRMRDIDQGREFRDTRDLPVRRLDGGGL